MAEDSDHLAGTFGTENTGGVLSGLLAEEDEFDRRALWRIGSWGAGAIGALVVAIMANQTSLAWRRDQLAAADLTRQAQQLQALTKESQNETRRLASAIDTLNSDRDRLYSRVTVLEQGLDSVTGAIARQNGPTGQAPVAASKPAATTEAQPPAQNQAAAPAVAPVTTTPAPVTSTVAPATTMVAPVATTVLAKSDPAPKADRPRTEAAAKEQNPAPAPPASPAASNAPAAAQPTPATPLMAAKSILAPPDPGALKLIEADKPASAHADESSASDVVASVTPKEPDASQPAAAQAAVQRTEFAVDVGTANSVGGLRALWRGLTRSNSELAGLRPIIMVRESATGLGMQLRLAAGPLTDAGAAAKICAALIESGRTCETSVFDGQRLAMKADEPAPALAPVPPQPHRRTYAPRRSKRDDPSPRPNSSSLSRLFSR